MYPMPVNGTRCHTLRSCPPPPPKLPVLRHLGIYAYRCSFLRAYSRLRPVAVEQAEALEQLRALVHGYRISVAVTASAPHPGVDTPADLLRVRRMIKR